MYLVMEPLFIDLPFVMITVLFGISAVPLGGMFYFMQKYDWPHDWEGQWWFFASIGFACIIIALGVMWTFIREPGTMNGPQTIFEIVVVCFASLLGIRSWQIWKPNSELEKLGKSLFSSSEKSSSKSVNKLEITLNGVALNGTDPEPMAAPSNAGASSGN